LINDGGVAGSYNIDGSGVGAPGAIFHIKGERLLRGFSSDGGVANSCNLAGSGVGLPYGMFHAKSTRSILRRTIGRLGTRSAIFVVYDCKHGLHWNTTLRRRLGWC
jgi:hypothetical protein